MSKLITLDYQGLAVTASVLRFNAVQPVLIPTQGQTPETPLKRKFTALLNVLAESFRSLAVAGVFSACLGRLRRNQQQPIDNHSESRQYALACFNKPPSREKLAQSGRPAAINSLLSGVFTSAYPLVLPFMVGRGKVRLCRAGSDCQFLTPCPLLAAHRLRTESGKEANLKGNIMVNQLDQQTQQNAMLASQSHDIAQSTDEIAKLIVQDANQKEFEGKNEVKAKDVGIKKEHIIASTPKKIIKTSKPNINSTKEITSSSSNDEWESF